MQTAPLVPPTLHDIYRARLVVGRYLPPTPLFRVPLLSRLLEADVWVKWENCQPIGAFKVRGGINLLHHLSPEERARGVITASSGNHGQSIAYAAVLFGTRALIAVPENANPDKVRAIRDLGAEVHFVGAIYDDCRAWAIAHARREGMRYIDAANEPLLIAGVGTLSLEVIERLPDVEVIIAPIGAGSGACGHCLGAKAINPRIRVVGVQAEGAPVVHRAFHERRLVSIDQVTTFADGLATRQAYELPVSILWRLLDDLVLVSDAEMRRAIRLLYEAAHQVAEPAGAAATAAALKYPEVVRGRQVVLVVSGGNLPAPLLREILSEE